MTGTQSSEAGGTLPRTTVACYSLLSWKHSDRLEGVVTLPPHFSRFVFLFVTAHYLGKVPVKCHIKVFWFSAFQ